MSLPPLRDFQRSALEALLRPEGAHVLLIAPTGSGKSRIYEELASRHRLRTLLVTPLVALARQQKERLSAMGVTESGARILNPESLQNRKTLAALARWKPEALVVDECHCLWDWGERFRPAFLQIPALLEKFSIRRSAWMTATLPPDARRDLLSRIDAPWVEIGSFGFPASLHLSATRVRWPERQRMAIEWIRAQSGAGLVFMPTREATERGARLLQRLGWKAAPYHAGLSEEEKHAAALALREGRIDVLVATSAFGMGMDFPHLRWALLWQAPASLLSLAQFIGRVGRDPARRAHAQILWDPVDFQNLRWIAAGGPRAESQILDVERFLTQVQCRRVALQRYFEPQQEGFISCGGSCDVCDENQRAVIFIRQTSVRQNITGARVVRGIDHATL